MENESETNQMNKPTGSNERNRSKYRQISEEDLKRILEAHKRWLETDEMKGKADLAQADLHQIDLSQALLQKAELEHANLEKTNLEGAKLNQACLSGANLSGANLVNADLEGANLRGASLKNAILKDTSLRKANLQYAELSDVTGLTADQLAGATVSGAKLPDDVVEFERLQQVNELGKTSRTIFLAMIGGCVYSWLSVATTTDVALLLNTASTPLPIIQTRVPLAGFYWAAPTILLSLYVYLHLYLQRLWSTLSFLPAIFPDGTPIDVKTYPWLLTSLARAYIPSLQQLWSPLGWLELRASMVTAWILVPATLAMFWIRYLPRHDWFGTGWQVVLVVSSIAFGKATFDLAKITLSGDLPKFKTPGLGTFSPGVTLRGHDRRSKGILVVTIISAVFAALLSLGAIKGTRDDGTHRFSSWIPSLFDVLGYRTYMDLTDTDISTRPDNSWNVNEEQQTQGTLEGVRGANLENRDLRYAIAKRAFLSKAILRNAKMEGADLGLAELQKADLTYADLSKANLRLANLQGAQIMFATLKEAKLTGVDFRDADLSQARGVTQAQLDVACGDKNTRPPPNLIIHYCPSK
jgi:uncharacterized protein YjbI with pentapeptide repeats